MHISFYFNLYPFKETGPSGHTEIQPTYVLACFALQQQHVSVRQPNLQAKL